MALSHHGAGAAGHAGSFPVVKVILTYFFIDCNPRRQYWAKWAVGIHGASYCACRGGDAPPAGYNDIFPTRAGAASTPLQPFYAALFILRKYRTIQWRIWRCLFRQSSLADFSIYRQ